MFERALSLIGDHRRLGKIAGLFLSRSFHSFSSLVFSLVVGKLLIVEEHGIYGQFVAQVTVIQAITEAGLQYSLIRYLSRSLHHQNQQEVASILRASLSLKFYAFLIAFILIASWATAGFFPILEGPLRLPGSPDHLTILLMVLLSGFGMSIFSFLDAVLVSHQKYRELAYWIPSTGVIRLALLTFFYASDPDHLTIEQALFAFLAGPYISVAIFFMIFPASFFEQKAEDHHRFHWIRQLFSYNRWLIAASFFSILSDWMEVLLLGQRPDAPFYHAARIPMQGFLILLATMQSVILPRFSVLENARDFAQNFKFIYKFLLPGVVLLLPGFWIFSWFLPFWYGNEYQLSISVFWILYPGFLLRLLFAPLGTALLALDRPAIVGIEAGLRMIAGVVTNSFLIPAYGIHGAAWSSLIAQTPGWIFLIVLFYRYLRTGVFPELLPRKLVE
ncbi:MAG: oligosaccharide flippase family protein [Leptospiraceae bacterium]|nr:oligosaccharide flippase family protein [Leptospiraceae bacterium]